MKTKNIKNAMEIIKKNAGASLLTASFLSFRDGQSLLSYNADPKTDALVARITSFIVDTFEKSGVGTLDNYFIIDVDADIAGIFVVEGDYCWSVGINKKEMPMGMFLNVILPEALAELDA